MIWCVYCISYFGCVYAWLFELCWLVLVCWLGLVSLTRVLLACWFCLLPGWVGLLYIVVLGLLVMFVWLGEFVVVFDGCVLYFLLCFGSLLSVLVWFVVLLLFLFIYVVACCLLVCYWLFCVFCLWLLFVVLFDSFGHYLFWLFSYCLDCYLVGFVLQVFCWLFELKCLAFGLCILFWVGFVVGCLRRLIVVFGCELCFGVYILLNFGFSFGIIGCCLSLWLICL